MKKNIFKTTIYICLAVVLAGVIIALSVYFNRKFAEKELILDSGWNVTVNGKEHINVTLSQFKLPGLVRGDKVILTRVLETTGFEQSVLRVQTRYSVVTVYLNGVRLYQYGKNYFDAGTIIGNGFHWVALPDNYNHRILRIEYEIGENEAFTYVDEIQIMDSLQVYSSLFVRNLITGIIACCLIAIGVISIGASLFTGLKDNRTHMLTWLGGFATFIAIWMICNSRLIEGMTRNLSLVCHLEYISMYLASINMILYVAVFFESPKKKKFFKWLAGGFVLMAIVLITLSVTNTIHFPKSVLFFQIVGLVSTVIVIVNLALEAARQKQAEKTVLIGVVCFFICVMLELLRYRYNKMCMPEDVINISVIPIGALIFILSMFASFFQRIMARVAENMEKKTLYNMAYRDALTGINNRAWCEKVMAEYEKDNVPATIINMDLNLFKMVNDTYGHAVGDELLVTFAKLLTDNFGQESCVGRMGGDEFVIISKYMPEDVIEEKMTKLLNNIEQINEKSGKPYKISVSYGYASDSTGNTYKPWKLYEMADAKMYEFKKECEGKITNGES